MKVRLISKTEQNNLKTDIVQEFNKMATKRKKIKASGRFGAGYGTRVRKKLNAIEEIQRKKQTSPFHPRGRAKRIAAGIWKCTKTGKIFAGKAYSLKN